MVKLSLRAPKWKRLGLAYCRAHGLTAATHGVVARTYLYRDAAGRMFAAIEQHAFHRAPPTGPGPSRAVRILLSTPTAGEQGAALRRKIVAAAHYAIDHAPDVHYAQDSRRMQWVRSWKSNHRRLPLPVWEDCSSSLTGLYCVSGAPDPNGRGYDGQGYTGTLVDHGRRLAGAAPSALIADYVVWCTAANGNDSHHVAMVISDAGTSDPLLYSHGSENGPYAIRFSTEHAIQTKLGHAAAIWLTNPDMPDRRR